MGSQKATSIKHNQVQNNKSKLSSLDSLKLSVLAFITFTGLLFFLLTINIEIKNYSLVAAANSSNSTTLSIKSLTDSIIKPTSANDIIWSAKYFRSNHKNKPDLRNVTTDIAYPPDNLKNVKGILITRWPLPESRKYDFSIRYVAEVNFEQGQYIFSGKVNDGVRVWVGNTKVLDYYKDRASAVDYSSKPVNLSGKQIVEVEYYQMYEEALLTFDWTKLDNPVVTIIPSIIPSVTLLPVTPTPSLTPTAISSATPTALPSVTPTVVPTFISTITPTAIPTITPSAIPTVVPTAIPTASPAVSISITPSILPTNVQAKLFESAIWDAKYFRSNHKTKPDLRNINADIAYPPDNLKKVTGIFLNRWPLPETRKYDFSIRWTTNALFNGKYNITGKANDGVRIWVDGKQVLNDWKDRATTANVKSADFEAYGNKIVEVEYYQMYEEPYLQLELNQLSTVVPTTTPSPIMTQSPTSTPTPVPTNIDGTCNTGQTYRLLSFDSDNDREPVKHADMNISLRGWNKIINDANLKSFVQYNGNTDIYAPNFYTIFDYARNRNNVTFNGVYKINNWIWQPIPSTGYEGLPIDSPSVTMVSLKMDANEPIHAPKSKLANGVLSPIVLYADFDSLTLNYTYEDSVAFGYTIHLENICVDKNLLDLYKSTSPAGLIKRESLPFINGNQIVGLAKNSEVWVSITDRGSFMDPRSEKDWWQ